MVVQRMVSSKSGWCVLAASICGFGLLVAAPVGGADLAIASRTKTATSPAASAHGSLSPGVATGAFGLDLMRAQGAGSLVLSPDGVAAAVWVPPSAVAQAYYCGDSTADLVKYATVGKSIQGVLLALERKQVNPGETIFARLVNRGKNLASYGQYHRIERYVGGEWISDPAGPHGPWTRKLWGLGPGRSGRCSSLGCASRSTSRDLSLRMASQSERYPCRPERGVWGTGATS